MDSKAETVAQEDGQNGRQAGVSGEPFTKSEQVRMCGNSVSPVVAAALVRANSADNAAAISRAAKKGRLAHPDLFGEAA